MNHDAAMWAEARLSRLVACLCVDHSQLRFEVLGTLAHTLEETGGAEARAVFTRLVETLRRHLTREEHVVFPLITLMEEASLQRRDPPPPLERGLQAVIADLVQEHAQIDALLRDLRACDGVGERISDLESAIRGCIRLENRVLYPRAIALERRLYGLSEAP